MRGGFEGWRSVALEFTALARETGCVGVDVLFVGGVGGGVARVTGVVLTCRSVAEARFGSRLVKVGARSILSEVGTGCILSDVLSVATSLASKGEALWVLSESRLMRLFSEVGGS